MHSASLSGLRFLSDVLVGVFREASALSLLHRFSVAGRTVQTRTCQQIEELRLMHVAE